MDNESLSVEDRYSREMLQHSPVGVFKTTIDGACFFVNKEWEKISGLSFDQSLGKGWMKVIFKEDIAMVSYAIKKALTERKKLSDFFFRIYHPSKGIRYCKTNFSLLSDEKDNFKYFIGFIQDATYEVQALHKQEQLTQNLQALISALEDIVLEIGMHKTIKNAWARDESMLFMPKSMLLGKTIDEIFGKQAAMFTEQIDEVIKSSEIKEFIYPHADSTLDKWYKAKVIPVNKNQYIQDNTLALVIQDYTKSMKYEIALKEAKGKLERREHLLDISQDLSLTSGWEYDSYTGEIFFTKQAYSLFDVDENFSPTIHNIRTFFDDEGKMLLDRRLLRTIEEKIPFDIELRINTAKHVKKWGRVIGVPILKEDKTILIRGALMDITQKKEVEMELIKAKNIAEAEMKSKTDFLSVMSHEIRTPLNNIIGLSNLLKLNYTSEQEEYINNLVFSADHLLKLINDILDLDKIENGKLELVLTEVNLFNLLENIKGQFIPLAKEKGIRIKCHADRRIPEIILADPFRLAQILNNLLSNAIKFTEKGGVTMSAKLKLHTDSEAIIHFSIKDTGIGIPVELRNIIFESFKQLHQTAIKKYPGTGLGLTITKKLIKQHNSEIFIKSQPGTETEFYFDLTFKLPVKGSSQANVNPELKITNFRNKLHGIRLLLAEDNPINMAVAKNQLQYFGINADCAINGEEALSLLENNHYDIALLDLYMPKIDGYSLSKIIMERYSSVHIIIYTADVTNEVIKNLEAISIHDILNKPFSPESVLKILLRVAHEKNILPG